MNKGYFLIAFGVFAILYGLYCLYRLLAMRKWQKTEGRIISSFKSFRRINFIEKMEDAEITYEYLVNGQVYRSSTIEATGQYSSKPSKTASSKVDRLLSKYPEGSVADVYYNPAFPRMSCLERGEGEAMLVRLIFGPLMIVVSYFIFL